MIELMCIELMFFISGIVVFFIFRMIFSKMTTCSWFGHEWEREESFQNGFFNRCAKCRKWEY